MFREVVVFGTLVGGALQLVDEVKKEEPSLCIAREDHAHGPQEWVVPDGSRLNFLTAAASGVIANLYGWYGLPS